MKLKMIRRGRFECHWRTTENMCGITSSNTPSYNYVCEIECGPVLDQHGFMIDQLDVDKYFQTKWSARAGGYTGHIALSCEKMALACVDDVKYLVEAHMMKAAGFSEIHRLSVTISFNETAAMTAEWSANDGQTCGSGSNKSNRKTSSRQRGAGKTDSVPRAKSRGLENDLEPERTRDSQLEKFLVRDKRRYSFRLASDGSIVSTV